MKLLLDTHILIWALAGDSRLPAKAKELIMDPENTVYYSVMSVWEVSIKHSAHPEHLEFSGLELSVFCDEAEYIPLDLKEKHIMALEELEAPGEPPIHSDPFDRILIAQSLSERMRFITHDAKIRQYPQNSIIYV